MPLNQSVFAPTQSGKTTPLPIQIMYLCAWFAPVLPLLVLAFVLMGVRCLPIWLANLFAGVSLIAGLFLTLASGVLSLFSTIQVVHGVTLTVAVASSFLIWAGDDKKPKPSSIAKLGIAGSAMAALWSLLTVPSILIQSHTIADGSPYCIAHHWPDTPVEALHELRGFSFYTEETGYKSTSEWYFHGLMIVDYPEEQKVYNWSPRRWRFDQVERPDGLIAHVRNACVPS